MGSGRRGIVVAQVHREDVRRALLRSLVGQPATNVVGGSLFCCAHRARVESSEGIVAVEGLDEGAAVKRGRRGQQTYKKGMKSHPLVKIIVVIDENQ